MADINLGAVPPVRATGMRIANAARGATGAGPATPSAPETAAVDSASAAQTLDAGAAPVDHARVSLIRKAIADGSYPVIPSRVGDAIIAAGILVWSSQE
jgi:negative regulator of flagellin synthesis FlgM